MLSNWLHAVWPCAVKERAGPALLHMYCPFTSIAFREACLGLPSEQRHRHSLLCTQHMQNTEPGGQLLFTLAWPMGSTKSLSNIFSLTGKDSPYRISFSRNTTGSGSLMEAFRSPRASSLSYGAMTYSQQRAPCCACAAAAAAPPDHLLQMRRAELPWQLPLHLFSLVQRFWFNSCHFAAAGTQHAAPAMGLSAATWATF